MSKFKVGDKVRVIYTHLEDRELYGIQKGQVYEITDIHYDEYFIASPKAGEDRLMFERQLELVEEDLIVHDDPKPFGEVSKSATGSLRFNEGKPEVSQVDPKFIMALADLMTASSKKYGKHNYALGQQYSTPFDSCMRHLMKFMQGENIDEESGKDHLIHAAANIMIMYTSTKLDNPDLDDRFFKGDKDEEK